MWQRILHPGGGSRLERGTADQGVSRYVSHPQTLLTRFAVIATR